MTTGHLALRRYEIRGVLGRGGTGIVYEAFDTKTSAVVALKTIEVDEAENLYRLKQEFRALSDVHHKNLMRFGELTCEAGQWFFTMELIRGRTFLEYVRPSEPPRERAPLAEVDRTVLRLCGADADATARWTRQDLTPRAGPTLDEARLRRALPQLIEVLCTLHEAGHVHRDVKPSNVLVAEDGRVVLLDFGLVTALFDRRILPRGLDDDLVGTPAYMAPEQLQERLAPSPASDWYAVGVMLFLALTGTLPFTGSSHEIMRAKGLREAQSARDLAPSAPLDLVALCTDLLRADPQARATGESVRARVGLPAAHRAFASSAPVFVGRARELAILEDSFTRVREGVGRRLVVEGEPGVGKSALVHRFLDARMSMRDKRGAIVLAGRCYEQENVPFKGVDTIVDALSDHLVACSDRDVEEITAGGARYLAAVFPVLTRVPVIARDLAEGRGVDNESGLREQAFAEMAAIVSSLAKRGVLVVYLDDVQWADADSLALLQRAFFHAGAGPSLFLATLRSGVEVTPALADLLAASERLVVRGLGDDESRALWDALWPMEAGAEARAAAMREAGGHPLFIAELARAARRTHVGPSTRLEDVLWARICERDEIEQRFLEMLALAGAPAPFEAIARAAGLDVGECSTRLGTLKAAQLIRVTRRGDERLVEAYHDRVRESIAEHAAAEREAERHLRLARALREASGDALAQRVFAILKHFDAAIALVVAEEERIGVAELHLVAARMARLATAYEKARHHALQGLAWIGHDAWLRAYALARDLHLERMEAEYLAGFPMAARATFETARAAVRSSEDIVALATAWIVLETAHGHFAEAIAVGREVLASLGAAIPARVTKAHVLAQYAANRWAQGSRSTAELARLPRLRDAAHATTMKLLIAVAPPAFFTDTHLMTWVMMRIAGLSMRHGVCEVSPYGFAGYGMVLAGAFEKYEEAAAFGQLAVDVNDRFHNESLASKVHLLAGCFIVSWTRPIAEAKASLRRAYESALKHGDTAYEAYAVTNLSILSFCEAASPRELQSVGEWAEAISARRKEADMAGINAALARYAMTLRGAPLPSSDAAFRATLASTSMLAKFYHAYSLAELAYLYGDVHRADALLMKANEGVQGIFGLPTTVELACLEALVAARRFDTASLAARAHLLLIVEMRARALASPAKSNPANFAVHSLMVRGELQRILGRTKDAALTFSRAIAEARARGMAKREGMALDLASAHAARLGDASRASAWRNEARLAYERWGATEIANHR